MEHGPTQESDIEKIYRIARELGIGLEEAADTCDAFHLAFSDEGLRRSIFGMIDQLDESAWKKGEPLGLIIRYTVELGEDGIRVGRYADEIPPGEVVSLTPRDRAMIFLKIKDNFPTQEFLGPVIVNRPEFLTNPKSEVQNSKSNCGVVCSDAEINNLPSLAKEGCQPPSADGVVCSDDGIPTESPSHWPDAPICLGPIRLKFEERFPFVFAAVSKARRSGASSCPTSSGRKALNAHLHLPPWAALPAGTPAFQSMSGLSPPRAIGELEHSVSKDVRRPLEIDVETFVSHLDL